MLFKAYQVFVLKDMKINPRNKWKKNCSLSLDK